MKPQSLSWSELNWTWLCTVAHYPCSLYICINKSFLRNWDPDRLLDHGATQLGVMKTQCAGFGQCAAATVPQIISGLCWKARL